SLEDIPSVLWWLDMVVTRFHCPLVGLSGCQDGSENGLTKTSLITHLRERHCSGEAQAITKHSLLTDLIVFRGPSLFSEGLRTVKSIPPKCCLRFSRVLKGALDKVICKSDDISCWVSLLVLPLCLLKTFVPRSNLECKSAIKRQRQEESIANAIRSWSLPGGSLQLVRETLAEPYPQWSAIDEEGIDLSERNVKQCKRKICDGHYTDALRVLSSSGVAPYYDDTLKDLKSKHPFKHVPSLPHISIDHHHLIASPTVVLDGIKSFSRSTSCRRDSLRAQHLLDCLSGAAVAISDKLVSSITQVVNLFLDGNCPKILGEYIDSAPLTPLVKPGGGIRPIAMGTVWRRLVSKVSDVLIGHSLDGYFDDLQFGVGVSGGGEAILHAVKRLTEDRGDDVGLSMLLVDFKNAFNFEVLELIMKDGPRCGLHLNVDKPEVFWLKEDPRSRLAGVFPPNISRPLHGVKLLGGHASVDFNFSTELVMKRVAKTIELMGIIAKINDPQCELLLLRACAGISKLYFAMRTCSSCVFEMAQRTFDAAIRSALKRDVLNYEFLASRLQSASLQTKLLRHSSIVASGPTFNDVLWLCGNLRWRITLQIGLGWFRFLGLGQTMNSKSYRCMLCYGLGVPLFSVSKPFSACSKVFAGDIYGDHAVSCAGIIGIKHRHNVVRDTLVDICLRSRILAGKEVDIGLDVCVDLTGSSPLTQTGMVDFVPGRVVIDVAHRKRVKYEAKCANIGYGFLPFSFSSLGELEMDAVNLLKRIRKFFVTQDIGARAVVHIFNRISFAIAKGVDAQLVSRLPTDFL
nr:hypothetical protein [Tanacetum cinerariifolium]